MMRILGKWLVLGSVFYLVMLCKDGYGQAPTYSVDFQGPVKGLPDGGGTPLIITEGEILTSLPLPASPVPPAVAIAASANPFGIPDLGLPPPAGPPGPGFPTMREVDALSYGMDYFLDSAAPVPVALTFSVDEYAAGIPSPFAPNVFTMGVLGAAEASADIFVMFPPPLLALLVPAPPFAIPPGNTHLFDGNGLAPPVVIIPPLPAAPLPHGLGLIEPNPPTPGLLPDMGTNLDAWDADTPVPIPFPVYFSLDCGFPDVLEPPIVNSGSAPFIGFSGADVLMTPVPGVPPVVYAPAAALGLDLAGFDTDDLDALVLAENGIPGYQASIFPFPPFDWGPGGADMLLFSVRRGSAVIGALDSCLGIMIGVGDILVPPIVPGGFPCILVAAENLGLATARTGPLGPFGPDDLDALDLSPDGNGNGIPDGLDLAYFGAPGVAPPPFDVAKNRYISFAPAVLVLPLAYQVTKTAGAGGLGVVGWVGAPTPAGLSSVLPAPVFRIWPEPVIHVGDCEIIPVATYDIAGSGDGVTFGPPLTVSTIAMPGLRFFGDTVGIFAGGAWTAPNGVVNVNDFQAVLLRFLGVATAPNVSVVDVQAVSSTDPCLNRAANIADVFLIIRAFQGVVYPFTTFPALCPPNTGLPGGCPL